MANPEMFDGSRLDKSYVHKEPKAKAQRTRAPLKPGKGPKQVSEKQAVTDKIHEAYRDAFIFLARRYDDLRCWHCGIECTPRQLDLHHEERRGRGGQHKAFNYSLACNRFSANGVNNCHDRLDGNDLRFTKESA